MDIGRIEKSELEDSLVQIDSERRGVEYEFGEIDEVSWAYATSIQNSRAQSIRWW
jgi:exodeoxyribonuclease V alpha subunit